MKPQTFTISAEESGGRIEVLVSRRFPEYSRTQWQKNGVFEIDNKAMPGKTKGIEGQTWTVSYQDDEPDFSYLVPWKYPLNILAESESWVVIEKPLGISVHPSTSEKSNKTIVNALIAHFGLNNLAKNEDEIDGEMIPRPGLVHRLDKTTSGVLLIAKTDEALRFFQSHWGEVEKYYWAVVSGIPPKKGRIEAGIMRDSMNRQKMTVSDHTRAKESFTEFETMDSNEEYSLLKLKLLTGRTHQIRIHLSSIGFPILGDTLYKGEKAEQIFLHATSLAFPDPDQKGKIMKVESEMPDNFWPVK